MRFSHRNDQLIDLCPDKADQVAAILSSGRSLRLDPYDLMALDKHKLYYRMGIDGSETVFELVDLLGKSGQQDSIMRGFYLDQRY